MSIPADRDPGEVLPSEWVARIEKDYGASSEVVARILSGTTGLAWTSLRLNPLRGDVEETREILARDGIAGPPVPWFPDAFVVDAETVGRASRHRCWSEGRVIAQSPSSLAAVGALAARPGDRVLDLCAAPGGKSAAIAASVGGELDLVANDRSRTRCHRMRAMFDVLGVAARIRTGPGERIDPARHGGFDRILVDAPCSGEGRFDRADPESWAKWSPRAAKRLASLQKSLLHAAIGLLRPGGTIVYSTCTFGRVENEGVVERAMRRYGDGVQPIEPSPIPSELPPGLPLLEPPGEEEAAESMRRFWPDPAGDEAARSLHGFFIARLRKSG